MKLFTELRHLRCFSSITACSIEISVRCNDDDDDDDNDDDTGTWQRERLCAGDGSH